MYFRGGVTCYLLTVSVHVYTAVGPGQYYELVAAGNCDVFMLIFGFIFSSSLKKVIVNVCLTPIVPLNILKGLYELTNALSNGTIPDPLRSLLPRDWGFATSLKLQSKISGKRVLIEK